MATTSREEQALATALGLTLHHAGFISAGRFQPGPNTVRIAKDVLANLVKQGFVISAVPCPRCDGDGRHPVEQMSEYRCPDCLGTGRKNGSKYE